MVSSVQTLPDLTQASLDDWLAGVSVLYSAEDAERLRQAIDFAAPLYEGFTVVGGCPMLTHALGTANILGNQKMDVESLVAAVLLGVPALAAPPLDAVEARFGSPVRRLVEGVARMSRIEAAGLLSGEAKGDGGAERQKQQAETLRQMLLAMVEDVRVVLIKLAERAQTLRDLATSDAPERRPIATEAMEIFAPLANRLGVWQLKWELEDLAFRFLEPERYKQVARLLDEKRADRQRYIESMVECLQRMADDAGIRVHDVSGRPKHIMSIVRKMTRKHKSFDQIYDVRAVRVLVDDLHDCYAMLALIHQAWQPIPGEFDDYIAHPKSNNYRALHTAVIGPESKALEIQICTADMYHQNEFGIAAHWRYKEGGSADRRVDEKIAWLRQIAQWKDDLAAAGDHNDAFHIELFQDRVYVLTPQGRVVDLPKGATPIDFAYALHTDLGHRCRGAMIDGVIAPLGTPLQNGQRVEILASKQGAPSLDWLSQGVVRTHRARSKIRAWFRQQNYEAHVASGRALLERELARLNAQSIGVDRLTAAFNHHKEEDFLAAVGRGDIGAGQVASFVATEWRKEAQAEALDAGPVVTRPSGGGSGKIMVAGESSLLTLMARCCKPLPPDEIVGYIARGRGAVIHRADCRNAQRLGEQWPERILPAGWGDAQRGRFMADIEVTAQERAGLMRDVTEVFSKEHIQVTAISGNTRGDAFRAQYTVQVSGGEQLSRLLHQLAQITGVVDVRRKS